jgi:hypothetical protein
VPAIDAALVDAKRARVSISDLGVGGALAVQPAPKALTQYPRLEIR